ncbi:RNA 2',3'-cyclic phosphodiesterase, partial [Halorhodospira neutriphila]
RLFFALWPPPWLREALAALQREHPGRGRPVSAEQMHLTVLFLGAAQPPAAAAAGAAAAREASAFRLVIDRLGYFARARVAWAGAEAAPAPLADLHRALRRELRRRDQPFDGKRLHPHITLFRKAAPPPRGALETPLEWPVERLTLVASERGVQGASYRVEAAWPLGGGADGAGGGTLLE